MNGNARLRGMSLVEIVVCLSMLVLGLLPMAQLLVATDHHRMDSELVYRMHLVAANRLEGVLLETGSVAELGRRYPAGTHALTLPRTELNGLPLGNTSATLEVELFGDHTALLSVHVDYIDATGKECRSKAATVLGESGS